MSGPPPKPTRLKELSGNPGHRPLNKREPRPEAGAPRRPRWLAGEARREWSRIVPELEDMGLLAKVDRAALTNYCVWWAQWVEAVRALREHGLVFTTENGYAVPRPEVAIAQKAAQLCKSFLTEFGLTPASRSRISLPAKETADEFSQFLASKKVANE